jgi:hypothetical protein
MKSSVYSLDCSLYYTVCHRKKQCAVKMIKGLILPLVNTESIYLASAIASSVDINSSSYM